MISLLSLLGVMEVPFSVEIEEDPGDIMSGEDCEVRISPGTCESGSVLTEVSPGCTGKDILLDTEEDRLVRVYPCWLWIGECRVGDGDFPYIQAWFVLYMCSCSPILLLSIGIPYPP